MILRLHFWVLSCNFTLQFAQTHLQLASLGNLQPRWMRSREHVTKIKVVLWLMKCKIVFRELVIRLYPHPPTTLPPLMIIVHLLNQTHIYCVLIWNSRDMGSKLHNALNISIIDWVQMGWTVESGPYQVKEYPHDLRLWNFGMFGENECQWMAFTGLKVILDSGWSCWKG